MSNDGNSIPLTQAFCEEGIKDPEVFFNSLPQNAMRLLSRPTHGTQKPTRMMTQHEKEILDVRKQLRQEYERFITENPQGGSNNICAHVDRAAVVEVYMKAERALTKTNKWQVFAEAHMKVDLILGKRRAWPDDPVFLEGKCLMDPLEPHYATPRIWYKDDVYGRAMATRLRRWQKEGYPKVTPPSALTEAEQTQQEEFIPRYETIDQYENGERQLSTTASDSNNNPGQSRIDSFTHTSPIILHTQADDETNEGAQETDTRGEAPISPDANSPFQVTRNRRNRSNAIPQAAPRRSTRMATQREMAAKIPKKRASQKGSRSEAKVAHPAVFESKIPKDGFKLVIAMRLTPSKLSKAMKLDLKPRNPCDLQPSLVIYDYRPFEGEFTSMVPKPQRRRNVRTMSKGLEYKLVKGPETGITPIKSKLVVLKLSPRILERIVNTTLEMQRATETLPRVRGSVTMDVQSQPEINSHSGPQVGFFAPPARSKRRRIAPEDSESSVSLRF